MNLQELYENREHLEELAGNNWQSKNGELKARLAEPEVLPDDVLDTFLAYYYLDGFKGLKDGVPIMSEIAGVIPTAFRKGDSFQEAIHSITIGDGPAEQTFHVPEGYKSSQVLAAALETLYMAHFGGEIIKKSDGSIESIEKEAIKERVYVVKENGVYKVLTWGLNAMNYDFFTKAVDDTKDLFLPHGALQMNAVGPLIVSKKRLAKQQYLFATPYNPHMNNLPELEAHVRMATMLNLKNQIKPKGFVAGFHITCTPDEIIINPVVGESEYRKHKGYLDNQDIRKIDSKIECFGSTDEYLGLQNINPNFFNTLN